MHNVSLRLRHIPLPCRRPLVTRYGAQSNYQTRRCIHHLRELPYDIEKGLGDFLSPAALRMIAVDYQQGLLSRLNEQVKDTGMEGQSVADTVISAASHREHALAFNYASQALNNSFFLESLQPPPPPPATNEADLGYGNLMQEIRMSFGTLEQLQSTFSAAAMGMINSGWVWLVSDEHGSMQVVATFGAGTLLVRSRSHMRTSDLPILGEPHNSRYKGPLLRRPELKTPYMNHPGSRQPPSATSPTSGLHKSSLGLSPSTPSRTLYASYMASQSNDIPNIYHGDLTPTAQSEKQREGGNGVDVGDMLTPLLCVSVHEHAWVGGGYGIWGKEEYLKRFWTVVNWKRVSSAFEKARQFG